MLDRIFFSVLFLAIFAAAVGLNAQTVDCGCETAPLPAAWAKLNGKPIAEADVDRAALSKVAELQKQVADARKEQLDVLINTRLLEFEAAKLNVTTDRLLDNEVTKKAKVPTDAEIEAYFNANKTAIETQAGRTLTLSDVKEQLRDYLTEQHRGERSKAYADELRAAYGAKKLVEEVPLPKTPADRQKVLATIGTYSIRSEDVEKSLRPLIYSTQTAVYDLRHHAVEQLMNDRLLDAEAAKRGVTTRAVLESEITAKVPAITDAQAQAFYDQNKARLNPDFPTLKAQIVSYMQDQEQQKLEDAFAERLRSAAQIEYLLPVPVAPKYDIDIADRPIMGAATAPVTIAAFVDFQCPTCAAFHETLLRVVNESNGKVRLVFFNYPLDKHKDAEKAAEAAEAAREQGKFWEYAALLYKNQSDLSIVKLKEYATTVGLDRTKFDSALDTGKFAMLIDAHERAGDAVGVNATPTIFINGRPTDAYDYTALKKAVETAKP